MPEQPKSLSEILSEADTGYTPLGGFSSFAGYHTDVMAWEERLLRLSRQGERASDLERSQALATVLRAAAVQTGAIEGLYEPTPVGVTLTLATEEEGWESELDQHDANARPHFDAQLDAYDQLLGMATGSEFPVTEAWIRELHKATCAGQEDYVAWTAVGPQRHPLRHGEYKSRPNHVFLRNGGIHSYCPVSDTGPEMARLVAVLRSREFEGAHCIVQATYAHWGLTHIHPFSDGNGRAARGLASYYLLRDHRVPLLIFADRKKAYFNALEAADAGSPSALLAYFENRHLDTLSWMAELLSEATGKTVGSSLEQLLAVVAEIAQDIEGPDDAAFRVHNAAKAEVQRTVVSDLEGLPGRFDVSENANWRYSLRSLPEGYRAIDHARVSDPGFVFDDLSVSGEIQITSPVDARASFGFIVGVAIRAGERFSCIVMPDAREIEPLELRLEDISPSLSAAAHARLITFSRRCVALAVQQADRDVRATLADHGEIPPT